MELYHVIIIGGVFLFFFGIALVAVFQQSRWPELKNMFALTEEPSVNLKGMQSGIINDADYRGFLAFGMNTDGIFIQFIGTIFIPYSELIMTSKRKYFRYTIFEIKGTDLRIGLPLEFTNQIKKHFQQSK